MHFLETIAAVTAGGVLTLLSGYVSDRRRERIEFRRQRDDERRKLRVAARLLRDEILDAMALAEETVLVEEAWPAEPARTLAWHVHAAAVARSLSHEAWAVVAIGYGNVLEFNRHVARMSGQALTEHDCEVIRDWLEEMQQGERVLLHAGGDAEEVARNLERYLAEFAAEDAATAAAAATHDSA
jgi:hypothetical protein